MPKPSPTVMTAPTANTAIQCLPRLRPSQPQNLCTMAPRQCARVSGPHATAAGAQTEGVSRYVALGTDRPARRRLSTLGSPLGRVAELADAQASGACVRKDVGVQVPPRPPHRAVVR